MFGGFAAFYSSGEVDGASVEEKFLGEGGFAGIGVGDDGKGSSFFDFFVDVLQGGPPKNVYTGRSCGGGQMIRVAAVAGHCSSSSYTSVR
jgi:hypothetical protein